MWAVGYEYSWAYGGPGTYFLPFTAVSISTFPTHWTPTYAQSICHLHCHEHTRVIAFHTPYLKQDFLPPPAKKPEVSSSCLATNLSSSMAVTMAMSVRPLSSSAQVSIFLLLLSPMLSSGQYATFESYAAEAGCQRPNLAHRPSHWTSNLAYYRAADQQDQQDQ